jgi:Zn-finger in ubiquitin-hydrolases and other protein
MTNNCAHLDHLQPVDPLPSGCEECLAYGRLDWVHLRVCQECGHVGCCDQSPGRHATDHFLISAHPVIWSYEAGEDWFWCYVDELAFELEGGPCAPSNS